MEVKRRPLYIFSFKITVFFIIVFLFVNLIGRGLEVPKDEKYEYAYNHLKNQGKSEGIDIFFMSNSYIFTGIDPLYLKRLTGLKSVHLGHHGMTLLYDYINLNNILGKFLPKYIVIDVSPPSLNHFKIDKPEVQYYAKKSLVYSSPSWEKIKVMHDLAAFDNLDFVMQSFSVFTSNLSKMNTFDFGRFFDKKENIDSYLGYQPLLNREEKNEKLWGKFEDVFYRKPSSNSSFYEFMNKKYLLKIMRLTQKKNVKLIFLNTLKYAPTRGIGKLDSLIKENKFNHVYTFDVNKHRRDIKFNIDDFSDMSHLHHSGALKQTKIFSNFLLRKVLKSPHSHFNKSINLNDIELKYFDFLNDENSGFYTQFCVDSNNTKKLLDYTLNLEYFSKGKKTNIKTKLFDSIIFVKDEYVKTLKTRLKLSNRNVDSVIAYLTPNTRRVMNIIPSLHSFVEKDNFRFSLFKISKNTYKFQVDLANNSRYEYVFYRYNGNKILDPVHQYSENNYTVFNSDSLEINKYHFECYFRPKKNDSLKKSVKKRIF